MGLEAVIQETDAATDPIGAVIAVDTQPAHGKHQGLRTLNEVAINDGAVDEKFIGTEAGLVDDLHLSEVKPDSTEYTADQPSQIRGGGILQTLR